METALDQEVAVWTEQPVTYKIFREVTQEIDFQFPVEFTFASYIFD